ncbi:MAG: LysR family transcriptional regulator [Micropepsaceae bacterium]
MHSIRQLRLVAALAAHGHFGRAAAALGLSQPALTKALKALEDYLGAPLFDRGPPVTPTAMGALVIARAQALTSGFDEMMRELALARGLDTGALVISAGGQVAEFAAIDAVAALSRAHPFIACELNLGDHVSVTRDVLEDRADLGIASLAATAGHETLTVEPLRRAPYVLFCRSGHPLAGHPGDDTLTAALLGFPWIGAGARVPPLADPAKGRLAFGDADPVTGMVTLRLRVNSFSALLRIVMDCDAISAAPAALIRPHIEAGRLIALRAPYGWPELDYGIIRKRGRTPSPAAEAYMAELRRLEAAFGA